MLPFESFSNILVTGISQSGKSQFIDRLCKHSKVMFQPTPVSRIIYVYQHYQDSFQELLRDVGDIYFTTELPDEKELNDLVKGSSHTLLIVDDALDALNNSICQDLCVRLSHHLRMSVVFSAQTGSLKGRFGPTITKNIHNNVIMRSPKEHFYVRNLGLTLGCYTLLRKAYDDATGSELYTYLNVCSHPRRSRDLQFSTNIFPDDKQPTFLYIDKNRDQM